MQPGTVFTSIMMKKTNRKTVCIEPWTDYLLHPCYSMRKKKEQSMHEYRATQRGKHMRCSLLPLAQLVPSFHTDALPTLHLMREERKHKCMYVQFVYRSLIAVASSITTTNILAFASHSTQRHLTLLTNTGGLAAEIQLFAAWALMTHFIQSESQESILPFILHFRYSDPQWKPRCRRQVVIWQSDNQSKTHNTTIESNGK